MSVIFDLTADTFDAPATGVASTSISISPPCLNLHTSHPRHYSPFPHSLHNELPTANTPHSITAPTFIDLTATPDSPLLTMARRTRARTPPPERPADHSHSLRERKPPAGTYVVSDDSDNEDDELRPSQGYNNNAASSSEESEEEDEPEPEPETPRERSSAGGRSLRAATTLKPPPGLADMVSTDKALASRKKSKKKGKSKAKAKRPVKKVVKKGEDEGELTVRGEIRQALEETKRRRDAFFLKNCELFENLLPESNYISKMADKELDLPEPVEYQLLEKQPEQ